MSGGHPSPWRLAWRRLVRSRVTVAAMLLLALMVLACVAGPWFSPYGPNDQNLDLRAITPGVYELIALPLRIKGGDGSPLRAILRG